MPPKKKPIMIFVCHNCQKEYKTKKRYENHMSYCKINYQTKEEILDQAVGVDEHLSMKELHLIIKNLCQKVDTLESEVRQLKNTVNKSVKTTNIVEFLNQTIHPGSHPTLVPFTATLQQMTFTQADLTQVFTGDYLPLLAEFIVRELTAAEHPPLRAFTEKKNKFYIYDTAPEPTAPEPTATTTAPEPTAPEPTWREMTKAEYETMITTATQKLQNQFSVWRKAHRDEILTATAESGDFTEKVRKVNGGNLTKPQIHSRLKERVFTKIKKDIKSFTQLAV